MLIGRGGDRSVEFFWGNLKKRGHWGDPLVDGRIILRWLFKK
jgi:hypothetical protein